MAQSAQIKSVRVWHEELIDFLIAHPRASGAEAALYFGVTQSWISTVIHSDAFQEMWAKRRGEHFSRVSATLVDKVHALADVAIEKIAHKIEVEDVSLGQLQEVGNMALKSLGFGPKPSAQAPTNVQQNNVFVVDRETLASAREARARLQASAPSGTQQVLEGEVLSPGPRKLPGGIISEGE